MRVCERPEVWLVRTMLGVVQIGSSAGAGSGEVTSRNAPAIVPRFTASISAGWSIRSPRAMLMITAEGFIACSSSGPMIRVVSRVAAAARMIQSNSPRRPRHSSGPMTPGSPDGVRRTPTTSTSKPVSRWAICRPMPP